MQVSNTRAHTLTRSVLQNIRPRPGVNRPGCVNRLLMRTCQQMRRGKQGWLKRCCAATLTAQRARAGGGTAWTANGAHARVDEHRGLGVVDAERGHLRAAQLHFNKELSERNLSTVHCAPPGAASRSGHVQHCVVLKSHHCSAENGSRQGIWRGEEAARRVMRGGASPCRPGRREVRGGEGRTSMKGNTAASSALMVSLPTSFCMSFSRLLSLWSCSSVLALW